MKLTLKLNESNKEIGKKIIKNLSYSLLFLLFAVLLIYSSHVGVFCWEVWVEVVEWCGGGGVEGRVGEKGALQLAGKTVAGDTVVGLNGGERRVSLARFHLWSL
nr:hypothetical protein [Tanacetum cinerariifolium]